MDETPEQPVDNTDALDYLKDQLTNNSGSPSKVKTSDLPSPNELKNSSESSRNSGNTSLSLPNTGEVRFWTILGIVLLMIGLLMLLANQITRRKRREKLDEIELD
ncbi:MAG: LPXTG cell wall anchor domain-containing protein [Erysipelothrix sp.]|nr:LPXTG cell wall anchor domain-containing protein [Erysipelothrix sp.]